MTIETRLVRDFDQVRLKGPGTLKITQCGEESLTIHAPGYALEDIQSEVIDGELHLGYRSRKVITLAVHREVISYDLKLKDLRGLTVNGSGKVLVPDLDNDQLNVKLMGSAHIDLQKLTADHIEVVLSGSGTISVKGDVESQQVKISGSGDYRSPNLVSDLADISLSGSGRAVIKVNAELNANISGSGSISYIGYPEVYKQVSGSGKLIRVRKERNNNKGKEHG